MKRRILGPFGWVFSLLVMAIASHAQITTGTITGTVFDQSGAVLPGVSLKLTNVGTDEMQAQLAGPSGEFHFTYLPVGQYTLRAELAGFASQNARTSRCQ
jgi:hypothetical protein